MRRTLDALTHRVLLEVKTWPLAVGVSRSCRQVAGPTSVHTSAARKRSGSHQEGTRPLTRRAWLAGVRSQLLQGLPHK